MISLFFNWLRAMQIQLFSSVKIFHAILFVNVFRSKFLHFWNLDSRQLIQIIELPEKVKEVKHVEFVTDKLAISQNQVSKLIPIMSYVSLWTVREKVKKFLLVGVPISSFCRLFGRNHYFFYFVGYQLVGIEPV